MDFNQSIEYCRERNRLRSLGLDPRLAKKPKDKELLAHIIIKKKDGSIVKESLVFKCSYCNHKLTKDMTNLKNEEMFEIYCPKCGHYNCKSKEERY